jgi:uncharacterized membrane protein
VQLGARWNGFWFRDAPYFDLAFMRVVIVAFQCYFLLDSQFGALKYVLSLPDDLYVLGPRMLRLFVWPWGFDSPPGDSVVFAVYWITLAAGLTSLLGLLTNASLCVFALGNLLLQCFIFSFGDYHHPEAILVIGLFALALSPSGQVLSVDNYRRGNGRKIAAHGAVALLDYSGPYAGWPIRFIQCFFPLMYISAVVAKIAYGNYSLDWANGYTLQYYMIQDDIRKVSPLALWVSQFHWSVLIGQVTVLFYQLTYFLVVPFARLRWIYLPIGLAFHFANYLILKAPFPQWILFLLLAYIPWSEAFKMLARARVPVAPVAGAV